MTTGALTIVMGNGKTVMSEMIPGQSYARKTGVAHTVINDNDFAITFVEIEAK
jgi:hypothetical protein